MTALYAVHPRPVGRFLIRACAMAGAMILGATAAADDLPADMVLIPGGQSGNALSPAYDDQLDLWLDGKYRILQHNSELRFREDMPVLILNRDK